MNIDPTWFEVLADLLINVAAGWFGAVFIVPNFSGLWWPYNLACGLDRRYFGWYIKFGYCLQVEKMVEGETMINVWDINIRALIAFSLVMMVGLLTYIAFFKKSVEKDYSSPRSH